MGSVSKIQDKKEADAKPRWIRVLLSERQAAAGLMFAVKAQGQEGRKLRRAIKAIHLSEDELDNLADLSNEEAILRSFRGKNIEDIRGSFGQHREADAALRDYRKSFSFVCVTVENLAAYLKHVVNTSEEHEMTAIYGLGDFPEQVSLASACEDEVAYYIAGPDDRLLAEAFESNPFNAGKDYPGDGA